LKVRGQHVAVITFTRNRVLVQREFWPSWLLQIAAPIVEFELPATVEEAVAAVDGWKSSISPTCKAEGIVLHSADGREFSELGQRGCFKIISNAYLLKHGWVFRAHHLELLFRSAEAGTWVMVDPGCIRWVRTDGSVRRCQTPPNQMAMILAWPWQDPQKYDAALVYRHDLGNRGVRFLVANDNETADFERLTGWNVLHTGMG
jgi:hypothetical protein